MPLQLLKKACNHSNNFISKLQFSLRFLHFTFLFIACLLLIKAFIFLIDPRLFLSKLHYLDVTRDFILKFSLRSKKQLLT